MSKKYHIRCIIQYCINDYIRYEKAATATETTRMSVHEEESSTTGNRITNTTAIVKVGSITSSLPIKKYLL